MFCGAFLDKKTNLLILTLKLAPSLVYHGLIRALLSRALNCFLLLLFEQRKLFIALTWGVTNRPQAPPCHLQQCM